MTLDVSAAAVGFLELLSLCLNTGKTSMVRLGEKVAK